MTSLRLVTRGDDAGSCHSANRAIREACEHGILRNVSVMVPGPAFEEAAGLFAGRADICLGLHVTLNAEWDGPKWGPVLPADQVPSLVDGDGFFLPTPRDLHQHGPSVEEMMAEVEAQLQRARDRGLNLEYLDEHMGVGWLPGLRERLADLCRREGLVDAHAVPGLPRAGDGSGDDLVAVWSARMDAAVTTPGAYVLVTHPGFDADDMRAFAHAGLAPGQIARERDSERRALQDPRLLQACQARGIQVIRYSDV